MQKLLNLIVTHVTLGTGKIVYQTKNTITVEFTNKKIKMQYPLAFEKYLVLEDKKTQSLIQKELKKAVAKRDEEEATHKELIKTKLEEVENYRKAHPIKSKKSDLEWSFEDFYEFTEDNDTIRPAIKNSTQKQIVIKEAEKIEEDSTTEVNNTLPEIIVSEKTAIQAAASYKNNKTCILSFASPDIPGGDFRTGVTTREAVICRTTTLYRSIANCWNDFYYPHKLAANPLNNNDIIYTPDVIVFNTDATNTDLLPEDDWFEVDILSCSVPKLIRKDHRKYIYKSDQTSISYEDLKKILDNRIKRIFEVAHFQKAEVLILGSMECSTNHIPREMVANCFKEAIEKYGKWFNKVEFAIPSWNVRNLDYKAFQKVFCETAGNDTIKTNHCNSINKAIHPFTKDELPASA